MQFKTLAALSLGFVFLFNLLFFQTQIGLGTGLMFLFLNIFFYITRNTNLKNLDYALASSATAIIFAFLITIRGNDILQMINYSLALVFSSIALFFYKYEDRFKLSLPNFLLIPLSSFTQTLSSLFSVFEGKEKTESSDNGSTSAIIRGSVFALILVAVLLWLLTQGDLVFSKIVNNFLSTIWERIIVSILVFALLFSVGLTKVKKHFSVLNSEVNLTHGKVYELAIILSSVVALFTVFIGVSFRYLFLPVAEENLREIGINSATYSEYVRAGFTELLIAATIVLCIIIYVSRFTHKLQDSQKWLIQILTAVLTIENGLLLLSATKRLFLYTEAHGLTRVREFGLAFLIWVGFILLIMLMGVLYKMSRELLAKSVLAVTVAIFISLSVFNLDELIAVSYPPTVNKEVDYSYITSLSTDGYKSWVPAISYIDSLFTELISKPSLDTEDYRKFTYARIAISKLDYKHIKYLNNTYGASSKWQSFNLSEYVAFQHMRDQREIFSKVPALILRANAIEAKFTDEVRINTKFDRSLY